MAKQKAEKATRNVREAIKPDLATEVLIESGYRCAVPTCRGLLAIDLHHIEEVSVGGKNELSNLIALCPTCHALFHRNKISRAAIYRWKAMLVAISQAFDKQAIDDLIFLSKPHKEVLPITGDGVLKFSRLIAAGLVDYKLFSNNGPFLYTYLVELTPKGKLFIEDWLSGDRNKLNEVPEDNREIIDGPNSENSTISLE